MSYTLDELYEAIAKTQRVLGNYKMSDEREYGSGALSFNTGSGRFRQVYASPGWEAQTFDQVIAERTETHIALQLEEFDPETGEYIGTNMTAGENDLPFTLTGDLEKDVERYFAVMSGYLSTLPDQSK